MESDNSEYHHHGDGQKVKPPRKERAKKDKPVNKRGSKVAKKEEEARADPERVENVENVEPIEHDKNNLIDDLKKVDSELSELKERAGELRKKRNNILDSLKA